MPMSTSTSFGPMYSIELPPTHSIASSVSLMCWKKPRIVPMRDVAGAKVCLSVSPSPCVVLVFGWASLGLGRPGHLVDHMRVHHKSRLIQQAAAVGT